MRKVLLVLLLGFGVLLTGCRADHAEDADQAEARILSAEEITAVFAERGLTLHPGEAGAENVFQRELNGQKPLVFLLDEAELIIYQFVSVKEREAGWEDFEKHTATGDLVPHKAYQEQSVLIFYLHDQGMASQEMYRQVEKVIPALLDRKESSS